MPINLAVLKAGNTKNTTYTKCVPTKSIVVIGLNTENTENTQKSNTQEKTDSYLLGEVKPEYTLAGGGIVQKPCGVLEIVPEENRNEVVTCKYCQHKKPYHPQDVCGKILPVSSGLVICGISGENMRLHTRRSCKDHIFSGG